MDLSEDRGEAAPLSIRALRQKRESQSKAQRNQPRLGSSSSSGSLRSDRSKEDGPDFKENTKMSPKRNQPRLGSSSSSGSLRSDRSKEDGPDFKENTKMSPKRNSRRSSPSRERAPEEGDRSVQEGSSLEESLKRQVRNRDTQELTDSAKQQRRETIQQQLQVCSSIRREVLRWSQLTD
ncbi:uncharacterized protein LOC112136387 isoform X1 [Oryzias melastigma]|uniref:uncharacterized protein LOC112136387 isoform X1 n=1 Tax=Oryzias melastigma TaxID=30732 RepID=UPI00168CD090|nr:uncharacterized protein LOC112136387 isoform X1 [Oryzias melastigma]XP_036070807.1 uncharacterized protein LOC112136387 isoform X1 [Oryzias melastigma]XP_036070808.1 uncharacterized protein LOC112136387 isoform X1 [Oryzias melastigma]